MTVDALLAGYGDMIEVWGHVAAGEPGRVTACAGRNGAGKSTFLNAVAGLLPIRAMTVRENRTIGQFSAKHKGSEGQATMADC